MLEVRFFSIGCCVFFEKVLIIKIKTITCHNCYNYGAVLQTFALQQYCATEFGECEVINYIPTYMEYNSRYRYIPDRWSSSLVGRCLYRLRHHPQILSLNGRKKKFDDFMAKYLSLTKEYKTYEELCCDPPYADVYICGSDQIWNGVNYQNGKDLAFYLGFVPDDKGKIAYAASFGRASIESCFLENKISYIKELDSVSVREVDGVNILRDYAIDACMVLDPVFLINKDIWKKMISTKESSEDPYVLVYDLGQTANLSRIVERYAKNYKVIIIGKSDLKIKNTTFIKNAGPIDFLRYIYNAEYIITNSFHCLAFSIIFEKNFVALKRDEINSRIDNLLNISNIRECGYVDDINKRYDYVSIQSSMSQFIDKSKQFLCEAMCQHE